MKCVILLNAFVVESQHFQLCCTRKVCSSHFVGLEIGFVFFKFESSINNEKPEKRKVLRMLFKNKNSLPPRSLTVEYKCDH